MQTDAASRRRCSPRRSAAGGRTHPPARWLPSVGSSSHDSCRQDRPERMQHFLKAASRVARAEIVSTLFLLEKLVAPDYPQPSLDASLGREAPPSLTGALERRGGRRRCRACSWRSSFQIVPSCAAMRRYCRPWNRMDQQPPNQANRAHRHARLTAWCRPLIGKPLGGFAWV